VNECTLGPVAMHLKIRYFPFGLVIIRLAKVVAVILGGIPSLHTSGKDIPVN